MPWPGEYLPPDDVPLFQNPGMEEQPTIHSEIGRHGMFASPLGLNIPTVSTPSSV